MSKRDEERHQKPEWIRTTINIDEKDRPKFERLKNKYKTSMKGLFDLGIDALLYKEKIPHPEAQEAFRAVGLDNLVSGATSLDCSEFMRQANFMLHTPDFATWISIGSHMGLLRQRIHRNLVTEIYLVPPPQGLERQALRDTSVFDLIFESDKRLKRSDISNVKIFHTKLPHLDIVVSDGYRTLYAPAVFHRHYAFAILNTKPDALDFHKSITRYISELPKDDITQALLDAVPKASARGRTRKRT